ncbi:asparagine synthetase B family protein [Paucibacter sp. Y2R2-4]|uniref:asparagine synthetase B family protein n=1 Tax=Paucibacter sp. Y2R2-4 TaxID=2893553 RepID=UPI0021E3EF2C|nr:asparagine synthase C-terminal domain-containing protein [Paucibacter sp. Y2R2-4]MCV2348561.1 asparagine synthase C-terminal domain-containing protein [Paucibacter sp. Y2R2-4]
MFFSGRPEFPGQSKRSSDSPQVVLEAWKAQLSSGPAHAAKAVRGDFAVALQTESGQTFLAVDRFGIQSLCYRVDGKQIHFAARADDLARDAEAIDPQAIFDYLYFHCIPSPRTVFKNVLRVPPGHYVWFDQGQLTVAPYWTPEFQPQEGLGFASARDEFRGLLKQAVSSQLCEGKPACFLSGGTDSSTVAGMIREATGQRPSTYSIGFEADGYDEMAYARIAAKHFDAEHHEIYFTPDELVANIPKVACFYDQPFGNSSALPAYYCAQRAKQDGVIKLLAGDGGDELFGGNSRYAKQRVFSWWQSVPGPIRRGLLEPLCMSDFAARTPLLKKAHSYVEQARVPMPGRLQMYNLLLRLGIHDMLCPDFLQQVDVDAPAHHQQSVWDMNAQASELNATLAFDWRYTLGESDLPKVRETSKLASIEVGFPMLDTALLDFSLKLPDDFKLRGLKLRWFFKEALRGFLPDEILSKKKQGFGLPFGVWMTQKPALKSLAEDSLRTLARRGIVKPEFIEQLLSVRLREHPGYYGEQVWILMMLEQWLRAKAPTYAAGNGRAV